jgi:hypothetical protein
VSRAAQLSVSSTVMASSRSPGDSEKPPTGSMSRLVYAPDRQSAASLAASPVVGSPAASSVANA